MKLCKQCKKCGKCKKPYSELSTYAERCKQFEEIKQTNYDRIKAMSVEEMAEFICSIYDDNGETYTADKNIEWDTIPDYDEYKIKEWLESEVSE